MSSNPGQEGVLAHDEHAEHGDAGIRNFFFGHVPEGVHGGLKQYGLMAIFLGIITLVEFLIIVPQDLRGTSIVIAPLVILSILKFYCVVAFFMHLKFEHKLLWQVFVAGLMLGLIVALSLGLLFSIFRPVPRGFAEERRVPFEHHEPEVEQFTPLVAPPPGLPGSNVPPPATGTGTPASPGQQVFAGAGGCSACHTIEGVTAGILGPDLTHVASTAGGRIPGYSAEEYIRESILEPDAYTVTSADDGIDQDFTVGLMQATMAGIVLSDEDVDNLTEYLLTLR